MQYRELENQTKQKVKKTTDRNRILFDKMQVLIFRYWEKISLESRMKVMRKY